MKYIEEGIDKNGDVCFFLLENADLVGTFATREEAESNL